MRRKLLALVAVTALAATAACGTDADPDDPPADPAPTAAPTPDDAGDHPDDDHGDADGDHWDSHPEIDYETGEMTAEGFNDLIDERAPAWATSPVTTVNEMLHLYRSEGTVQVDEEPGDGQAVVTATVSELPDDSVEAQRYVVTLVQGEDGMYRFESGQWSQRCQPGRGHEDFEAALCL